MIELRANAQLNLPPGMNCLAAILATLLVASAFALFPTRRSRAVYLLSGWLFVAVNMINTCAPGWCERFGFPFRYSWSSERALLR